MQDQNQILSLQELTETSLDGAGQAEAGFTHVGSQISVFSECTSVSINPTTIW